VSLDQVMGSRMVSTPLHLLECCPRSDGSVAVLFASKEKARELVEAGNDALVAAQKHDTDGVSNAGERIDVACDQCHEKYQVTEEDYKGKVLGTFRPGAAAKK